MSEPLSKSQSEAGSWPALATTVPGTFPAIVLVVPPIGEGAGRGDLVEEDPLIPG